MVTMNEYYEYDFELETSLQVEVEYYGSLKTHFVD